MPSGHEGRGLFMSPLAFRLRTAGACNSQIQTSLLHLPPGGLQIIFEQTLLAFETHIWTNLRKRYRVDVALLTTCCSIHFLTYTLPFKVNSIDNRLDCHSIDTFRICAEDW